jgi:fibronectin type 3 domain-containing protein
MTITKKIFFLTIIIAGSIAKIYGQNAIAISSNPGPGLHVALIWQPLSPAVKYNIYRKNESEVSYPTTPINSIPIQPASNCFTIKSLLISSSDSTHWKIVSKGLADSVLFDPCQMNNLSAGSEKYDRLLMLTKSSMPIAIAAGLGYQDNGVTLGNTYYYKVVGLNAANVVVGDVATDLKVKAGSFTPVPPPTSVIAEPGDAAILVRWNKVGGAAGYILERAASPFGIYRRVNESEYATVVKHHLNGDTLIPASEGMLDFQRYNPVTGKPTSHLVKGLVIFGPRNGVNYYYRVRSLDLFKRAGSPSGYSNPAKPIDSTRPSVPIDLMATPDDIMGQVSVRWTQVVKDINGHWEQPDSSVSYRLYRFTTSENPNSSPSVFLGEVSALKGKHSRDTIDADPNLRSQYGNKTWWYRIRAVDTSHNISQWSSAVSAIVKDVTAPAIVHTISTKGFEDYISIKWQLNTEPDIASYVIYRSLCHLGSWVECNPKDTCKTWSYYDPQKTVNEKEGESSPERDRELRNRKLPCPCSGPFVFLGEITNDSAKKALNAGHYFFDDKTIPKASPLCYAYWIKAKDSSDNISGTFPLPSSAERLEIKCERLHDLTPPEPAIISGLFAQADQIRVEWIGPPTQDTRAYHVYRAEGTDPATEPALSEYNWVGGMTIELPPAMPMILTSPYHAPALATCDKISVQATPWMSEGYLEDKKINPKLTYWYRVVGIDYDGNETPLNKSAAISTFTFTKKIPDAPVIDVIAKQAEPCGVTLQWSPSFDATKHIGFMIFRSSTLTGPFIPILISPVKGNSFTDMNVVNGQTYWYRLGILMKNGRLSELTAAQSITL